MSVHYHDSSPKVAPTPGTIEASPQHRAYVYYLCQKYIAWRKKGITEMGDDRPFDAKAAPSAIQNAVGFPLYKSGLESFQTIQDVVKGMIDQTVFGCYNTSEKRRNYHSFEEHQNKMVRRKKTKVKAT